MPIVHGHPRGGCSALLLLALLTPLAPLGCKDEGLLGKQKDRLTDAGDYITRVRGAKGRRNVPVLLEAARPLGGGTVARLLVQPLDKRLLRGRFVRVLYVSDPAQVAAVRGALLAARSAPFRTCEPTWRLDVRYGHFTHLARLNIPCERLEVDGKSLAYDGRVAEVIRGFVRRAVRRPTHKLLRVRVPVEHDPALILKALSGRVVEAYLPERPVRRGPHRKVFFTIARRAPSDPRQLDAAVAAIRKTARSSLSSYAYQLKVGRHEVVAVQGPSVVYERFGARVFEARYAIDVLFKLGTPDYMLGFLGLGEHFSVGHVVRPKDYQVDAIFRYDTRVSQMRKTIAQVAVKPPLGSY